MAKKATTKAAQKTETPERVMSDEGIPCAWIDHEHVVNLADDEPQNKPSHNRRELRINGKPFLHVRENADGQWIYHHDAR